MKRTFRDPGGIGDDILVSLSCCHACSFAIPNTHRAVVAARDEKPPVHLRYIEHAKNYGKTQDIYGAVIAIPGEARGNGGNPVIVLTGQCRLGWLQCLDVLYRYHFFLHGSAPIIKRRERNK
jgi:hypothetical protein